MLLFVLKAAARLTSVLQCSAVLVVVTPTPPYLLLVSNSHFHVHRDPCVLQYCCSKLGPCTIPSSTRWLNGTDL